MTVGEKIQKYRKNLNLSQEELGQKLGINQAAVSRRQKRAQFDLVLSLDRYFRVQIKQLNAL